MINISWINEQIAISRAFSAADISQIKEAGIDAVVDARSEYTDNQQLIKKAGLLFYNIPIDDRYNPSIKQLEKLFKFVEPLLESGKKILIHCQNAYGRAPLITTIILAKRGMEIPDALDLITSRHPTVDFSREQELFLYVKFEEYLKG
jgi:protein-tyrosine phosphatase